MLGHVNHVIAHLKQGGADDMAAVSTLKTLTAAKLQHNQLAKISCTQNYSING